MAFAATVHWVVSHPELLGFGFSESQIKRLLAAQRLHRLYKGVYAVGNPQLTVTGKRLAAVKACGKAALLSHYTAGDQLGIRATEAALIHVTVPRSSYRRHAGIRVHRSSTLVDEDMTVANGAPCTSVARTLLDLSTLTDDRGVERAIEQANLEEIYDHRAVERIAARCAGMPGVPRLARVSGIAVPGKTATKSGLEEAMLALCRQAGFPEPELNQWIDLGGEPAQVDFLWRAERVVIEVDSWKYHRQHGQFRRDRRRDQLLELEGWGHARFTDDEISHEPQHVEAVTRRLLARSDGAGKKRAA